MAAASSFKVRYFPPFKHRVSMLHANPLSSFRNAIHLNQTITSLHYSSIHNPTQFLVHCINSDSSSPHDSSSESVLGVPRLNFSDESYDLVTRNRQDQNFNMNVENGNLSSNDGNGSGGNGDSSGYDGDAGTGDDDGEREFGPLLSFARVIEECEVRGVELPDDMLEAAKTSGLREMFLFRYLDLQKSRWLLGFMIKYCSMLRNRMLVDPSFLFKVVTEVVIDSCCATFAEVKKRGKNFWSEFELCAADLLVGMVVDIALVSMLAPYARIGQPSATKGFFGYLQQACRALPSSVFEAESPGCRFSMNQRVASFFYKGLLYGSVGFVCGLIGQGLANLIMNAKRSIKKSEDDVPVPPLVQSATLWGVFLAVSSNTRYQIINALEHFVEQLPLTKQMPLISMIFTIAARFCNNIYGSMQFVDWAKLSGVQ